MASHLSNLNICTPFLTSQNCQSCFINRPSISIAPCKPKAHEGRQRVLCARTKPQPAPVVVFSRFPETRTIQQMMNAMNRLMSARLPPVPPGDRFGPRKGVDIEADGHHGHQREKMNTKLGLTCRV